MAQLTYVGQGQPAALGPLAASAMLLMSIVFALLGIKIWGFRRRLTFDRGPSTTRTVQQQPQTAPRYAAFESQVNGTDNAVHGVFRQRNIDEFESPRPANTTANKHITGSVPNLPLATLAPYEYKQELNIPELADPVPFRPNPEAARRKRREVRSASHDIYSTPPTRQPPAPPVEVAVGEAPTQLDIPNFDHFAEKYELISAKPVNEEAKETRLTNKERGRYVKYEQVDDVPELLTPDDDQVGAAISVAAQVHHIPVVSQAKAVPEPKPDPEPERELNQELSYNGPHLELEHTESAFVVEIIAGTPDSIDPREPDLTRNLFVNLEIPHHVEEAEFERIRASYEMNEADILDIQPDFSELQTPTSVPSSPPGFGKNIDDDWENFKDLDIITEVPQPNWSLHPVVLSSPEQEQSATSLGLDNVVQRESLFQQIELIEPTIMEERPQLVENLVEPPPYDHEPPALPILPDYESLMQLDSSKTKDNLPKYADVGGNRAKYVSSIEDLFVDLEVNEERPTVSSTSHVEEVSNFEELCEELEIAPSPVAARRAPQPAPRMPKPTTLSTRGSGAPLNCYEPGELSSSSSSDTEVEVIVPQPRTQPQSQPPQPAKRTGRTLKVRFDVENLQYYQAADVPSSNESDVEYESADEQEPELPPLPNQRLMPLRSSEPFTNGDRDMPRLFSTQVSQEDSDDEIFGRAIQEHRSMTEALRPAVQLGRTAQSGRHTEA